MSGSISKQTSHTAQSSKSTPKHLVLVGYRGSGKTSVGQHLARLLGFEWLDTDLAIQEKTGRSIREIFAEDGEPAFRQLEAAILNDFITDCSQMPASVISSGGGMVMTESNRRLLKKLGPVVWLKVSPETAMARITTDSYSKEQRPALTDNNLATEIREMIAERAPYYSATADLTVPNDTPNVSAEDLAMQILDRLRDSNWYAFMMNHLDA